MIDESTQKTLAIILTISVMVAIPMLVWSFVLGPEHKAEVAAKARMEARPKTTADTSAIARVQATWRRSFSIDRWETARLARGIAVLGDDFTAYWISEDGRVFAANGNAMTMSPDIPVAPIGINYPSIRAALGYWD